MGNYVLVAIPGTRKADIKSVFCSILRLHWHHNWRFSFCTGRDTWRKQLNAGLLSFKIYFPGSRNFHPVGQNNNLNSQWVALIPAQFSKSKQKTFPLDKAPIPTKSEPLNLNFVSPSQKWLICTGLLPLAPSMNLLQASSRRLTQAELCGQKL